MNKVKYLIPVLLIAFASTASIGQVEKVSYSLEFNAEKCMFDVFINIDKGHSKKTTDRVQLNSQISVITPANTNVTVEETYMPLIDNQEKRSETPASWEVTSMLDAPEVTPNLSYHSITPYLTPAAFYDDVKSGDKIKLFTISVEPFVNCASDVRLFDNDTDPKSTDVGMRGASFTNGFTIGGLHQSYNGNTDKVGPAVPVINELYKKGNAIHTDVDYLAVSSCQGKLDYLWMKGDKVIKTGVEAPALSNAQIRSGNYKLVLRDGLGCTAEQQITIYGDHTAGQTSTLGADKGNIATSGTGIGNAGEATSTAQMADVETEVQMFPNPAKDFVNVDVVANIGSKVNASITDANGRVVKSNVINTTMTAQQSSHRVSIADLATGLFNVTIAIDGEHFETKKLIIIE